MAECDLHSSSSGSESESSGRVKTPRKKRARKSKKEETPLNVRITYDTDGNLSEIRFFENPDILHNDEGPAITKFKPDGKPYLRQFYINGKFLGEIFIDRYGIPSVKMVKGLRNFPAQKEFIKERNLWTGNKTFEGMNKLKVAEYSMLPVFNAGPFDYHKIATRIPTPK